MSNFAIKHADELLNTIQTLYMSTQNMEVAAGEHIQPLLDILHPASKNHERRMYSCWKDGDASAEDAVITGFYYDDIEKVVAIPRAVWESEDPMQAARDHMSQQPACGADRKEQVRKQIRELQRELQALEDNDE